MDKSLAHKVALITGGAKRLGGTIARALHGEGANIVIHYRSSQAAAEELAQELNVLRANSAYALAADLLNISALPILIEQTVGKFARLDLLVNNASAFYPTPIGTITEQQWDELVGSNLQAPLFLAQAAAPHLRRTQGLILNMVDIHAQRPLPEHPVYSVAKAGLVALTKSLARELGPLGITCNNIPPRFVMNTVMSEQHFIDSQKSREDWINAGPIRRQGEPEDIAGACAWLVSDEAGYVTGQTIGVNGGRYI